MVLLSIEVLESWSMELAKCKTVLVHSLKLYGRVEIQFRSILTSELVGDEWLATCPGRLLWGKSHQYLLSSRLGVT